jgi:transcriptional regulator with XRE-family HTH domain
LKELEKAFGLALRQLRKEKGLSQEQLAALSELHRTYISLLERGHKSPSLTTIFHLCNTLSIPPHQIILQTEMNIEIRSGRPERNSAL